MPEYEYRCIECGKKFQVTATLNEKKKEETCPDCSSKRVQQVFNNVNIGGSSCRLDTFFKPG